MFVTMSFRVFALIARMMSMPVGFATMLSLFHFGLLPVEKIESVVSIMLEFTFDLVQKRPRFACGVSIDECVFS